MKIDPKVKKTKRIPAFFGLLILLVILFAGTFLINRLKSLSSSASSVISPQLIKITNTGSNFFVVSWITQNASTGIVQFGETSALENLKKDVRDENRSKSEKYRTHYVLVDNLKAETKYFFKIISDGAVYDNSQKPFEVTTGPVKIPTDNDIAQGRILTAEKQPAAGVIVYLSIANAVTQSALTDSSGNWIIPLSLTRNLNLTNFSNYDRSAQVEEIFVQADNQTASATLTTRSDNPVPDITLGQNHNFLNQLPQIPNTPTPVVQNPEGNPPAGGGFQQENTSLSITSPSESEQINNSLPEFLGTAPKDQKLDIKIESEESISANTVADQKGNWQWSPPSTLSPGPHTITVSFTDSNGFIRKVSRSFTVLAEGASDLPAFTATPSGKLATPTTTPTPSLKITVSPSPSLSPSLVPTIPYRTTLPSTESGIYHPGTTLPTKLLFGSGLAIILIGAALILF